MGIRSLVRLPQVPSWVQGYVRLASWLVMHIALKIWWGFVLMMTWNWFIPATFHTAPRFGIAAAVGVILVFTIVAYLFLPDKFEDKDEDGPWYIRLGSQVATHLLNGGLWLLVGLIVVSVFM